MGSVLLPLAAFSSSCLPAFATLQLLDASTVRPSQEFALHRYFPIALVTSMCLFLSMIPFFVPYCIFIVVRLSQKFALYIYFPIALVTSMCLFRSLIPFFVPYCIVTGCINCGAPVAGIRSLLIFPHCSCNF